MEEHCWSAVGASVTGTNHLQKGTGNDDAFAYAVLDSDTLVAAVADGAGSYSGTSAMGSHVACKAVLSAATARPDLCEVVRSLGPDGLESEIRSLFNAAFEAVESKAMDQGLAVRELSTTLTVAVVTPRLSIFGQIGDGIAVGRTGDELSTFVPEEKGEYINETDFLTSREALADNLRLQVVDNLTAFALSTDGLRYKILDLEANRPYEPFFRGLWKELATRVLPDEALANFISNVEDDQTGDDKTLVAAVFAPRNGRATVHQTASSAAPDSADGQATIDEES